jgi:hypothetical protein
MNKLAMSLSAADLHVVVMGDTFAGIVHPCKIYNILEIGSPVLYVGPTTSHIMDVIATLEDRDLVCSARHGEVDTVADYIVAGAENLAGRRSPSATKVAATFSRETLLPKIVDFIEKEARGQRSEVRGRRSEVRGQRSEVRGQRSEVRSQKSDEESLV